MSRKNSPQIYQQWVLILLRLLIKSSAFEYYFRLFVDNIRCGWLIFRHAHSIELIFDPAVEIYFCKR